MGPGCRFPDRDVRWWAGLKRSDGVNYHRCVCGTLHLRKEEKSFSTVADLMHFPQSEAVVQNLVSEGRMTVFFRLHAKSSFAAEDACVHDVADVPAWGDGTVLVETCRFHKVFQWKVDLPRRGIMCHVSPELAFGCQRFRLELTSKWYVHVELNLYRLGLSEKKDVEWCVGIKRGDGSYYKHEYGYMDLQIDCQLSRKVKTLKRMTETDMEEIHVGHDRTLTVVILLQNGSPISPATDVCIHSADHILTRADGVLLEEHCFSYKEVEWNVHCGTALKRVRNLTSPVFVLGNQHFLLELSLINGVCLSLKLMRMGPSHDGSAQWWAGMKHGDGTYYKRIESKKLELRRSCELWTDVESLKTVTLSELDAENLIVDECAIFFVRMNTDKQPDICNTGFHEVFARGKESIREVESYSSKHIEWDVSYEPSQRNWSLTSPLFLILNKYYMFELCFQDGFLQLYLLGSPYLDDTTGSVTFWAGLKYEDGTFNHKNKNRKMNLVTKWYAWSRVSLLMKICQDQLENEYILPNGIITIFLTTNLQKVKTTQELISMLDIVMVPSRSEGMVTVEECASYGHMEWELDYPQELRTMTSPEFRMGNQCYVLELSVEPGVIRLLLYRKGPDVQSCGNALCWAGMKRSDGSYYHRNMRGKLRRHSECTTWRIAKLLYNYTTFEVEEKLLSPCKKLAVFFRLSLDGSSEAFDLDSSINSSQSDGSIREEEVICCKEMEWTVGFQTDPPKGYVAVSPEFTFNEQRFLLQLTAESENYAALNWFRFGPYANRRILWWAGLKRADGSYYHRTESGELMLDKDAEIWRLQKVLNRIKTSELEMNHLVVDGKITFFLRLIEATSETSFCRSIELSALGTGTIRKDTWSDKWKWSIDSPPKEDIWTLLSPVFKVGQHRYIIELSKRSLPRVFFTLYRMSINCPVHFWAGLEKSDAAYFRRTEKGTFGLKDNFEVWREYMCLYKIYGLETLEYNRKLVRNLTFTFQVSVEQPSPESEACNHGSIDYGNIRIEECHSHMFVEWNVDYEQKEFNEYWRLISSSFAIENQHYMLELCSLQNTTAVDLNLHRLGPSVGSPDGYARWWVDMYCCKSTQGYRNRSGELNLEEECDTWKKVKHLNRFDRDELKGSGHITFSWWLSSHRSSNSMEDCIHDTRVMSMPRVGSIQAEDWTSCKEVEWQVDCALMLTGNGMFTSPHFSIGNQRFILDLSRVGYYWGVRLFRRGSYEDCCARWYLGLKRFTGVYDHHQNKSGILDLEKPCDVWEEVENARLFIFDGRKLDKRMHLAITFILIWDPGSKNAETQNNDSNLLTKSSHMDNGGVVFQVHGKEFKTHKAVLSLRVPALAAVFHNDSVEKRTGVVHIVDCDPITFENFIKYVETDELPDMSTYEVFDLFMLADKYLMHPLKSRCLKQIKYDTLTADNICELMELIIRCEALDISENATEFFARDANSAENGAWEKFKKKYPEIALDLKNGDLQYLKKSTRRSY